MAFKELNATQWVDELDRALEYRKEFGGEEDWFKLEEQFYSSAKRMNHAAPNIIVSQGDALMSMLSVPEPKITISARRPEFVDNVRTIEALDNDLIDDLETDDAFGEAAIHAFLWGVGILKIGYDSEWGYNRKFNVNDDFSLTFTQFDKKSRLIEFGPATPGMPWVKAVLPHDFLVPWGTPPKLDFAPWAAHRFIRHIEDFRSDPKYSNHSDLKPQMSMKDFMNSYKRAIHPFRIGDSINPSPNLAKEDKHEYLEAWEIHDRRTGRIYVVVPGHKKFLRNEPDVLQLEGLPFIPISFVPKARTFWVTSDAKFLKTSQAELTDIALQSTKHRRISNLKVIADENAFDESEINKLTSAEAGPVVFKKAGVSMDDAIRLVQPSPNLQIGVDREAVRRDAREMVGFSRNQTGEFEQTGRRTATEAAIVDRASAMRMDRRQLVYAKGYKSLFKKINAIVFFLWRTPRIQEILGESGLPSFEKFTGPQLQGEYKYKVSFSSEPPESQASRQQNAMGVFQIFSQDQAVDPAKLRQYVINAFNDPEFSSIFPPGVLGNADIPIQLPEVQGGQGVPGPNVGGGPGANVRNLQISPGA